VRILLILTWHEEQWWAVVNTAMSFRFQ
jgi:hypothetical protein